MSITTAPSSAEATRARIADAAEKLFRNMGYQKTAVADIARELGMSPANVYRFFASKSAINEAITARLLDGLLARLDAVIGGPGSAETRLHAFTQDTLNSCLSLFFHEKRMHDMVSAAMGEDWGVIRDYLERFIEMIARLVAEGMAAGEFAPGCPQAAARVIKGCTVAWHHPALLAECMQAMERTPADLSADLRQAMNLIISGLKRGTR